MKLAIVTNNQRFRDTVEACFIEGGHDVVVFADDQHLIRALGRDTFGAIIMDVSDQNPHLPWHETRPLLTSRACQSKHQAPLIMVGHFADRASLDNAFNSGADEIARLPIDTDELYVRTLRAVRLYQCDPNVGETMSVAGYALDKRQGTVSIGPHDVRLTPREFAIAWMLFARPGQYLSRSQIAVAVWGCAEEVAGRTLEQHIYKLRKKLQLNGQYGARLSTQYAHGYRIETMDWNDDTTKARPGSIRAVKVEPPDPHEQDDSLDNNMHTLSLSL